MRIIFMGTPEFAVPSLDILNQNFNVVAVVTMPDKKGGRGNATIESPIKKYAQEKAIELLQPEKLKSKSFLKRLKEIDADIFVVVAFRMLPEVVWIMPRLGTINVHGSLLPKYRGAAPIQRAIMAGEKFTGLSTFKLQHAIDTGDIIENIICPIGPDETGGELHDKMKLLGAELILSTISKFDTNTVSFVSQDESLACPAPKIFTEDCAINWTQNTAIVYNLIRALSPYPCAWFKKDNILYKIIQARKIETSHTYQPGEWIIPNNKTLHIACVDGFISILEIQREGKRKMGVGDFLNGIN